MNMAPLNSPSSFPPVLSCTTNFFLIGVNKKCLELTWNDFLIIPIISHIIHISSIRWEGVKWRTLKTLTHFEKFYIFYLEI